MKPCAKGIYQHFKGNYYELVDCARHSETLEDVVVYRALYGNFGLWVRPLSLFVENVDSITGPIPRFKFIESKTAHEFLANVSDV